MKKSKIIALGLVLSIILMGAGYASWNESITINNNLTTGELKVEFVESWLGSSRIHPSANDFEINPHNYMDAYISSNDAKTTTVQIDDFYPGQTYRFDVRIQNTGSIPAKFNDVTVDLSNVPEALKDDILVFGFINKMSPGSLKPVETREFLPASWGFSGAVTLRNLESKLREKLAGIELDKDEFIVFDVPEEYEQVLEENLEGYNSNADENCVFFHFLDSTDNDTQDNTASFDIIIDFKQFNQ